MKYLRHKERNGFAIIGNNNILTFECHRQGCEISQLQQINESKYYEENKEFVLSQLYVVKQEINEIIIN